MGQELPVALLGDRGVGEVAGVVALIDAAQHELAAGDARRVAVEPEGEYGLGHLALGQERVPHRRHAVNGDGVEAKTKDTVELCVSCRVVSNRTHAIAHTRTHRHAWSGGGERT